MYSKDQKLKAVLHYIKYGCKSSFTIKELGISAARADLEDELT